MIIKRSTGSDRMPRNMTKSREYAKTHKFRTGKKVRGLQYGTHCKLNHLDKMIVSFLETPRWFRMRFSSFDKVYFITFHLDRVYKKELEHLFWSWPHWFFYQKFKKPFFVTKCPVTYMKNFLAKSFAVEKVTSLVKNVKNMVLTLSRCKKWSSDTKNSQILGTCRT
jgi:hypothetical protein